MNQEDIRMINSAIEEFKEALIVQITTLFKEVEEREDRVMLEDLVSIIKEA